MQKAKLLKLAKFLREYVKDRWFDLGRWAEKGFIEKKCGTTACALGWTPACFPRSGFKLENGLHGSICPVFKDSKGNAFEDYEAGEKFFGLTAAQADYLFNPDNYRVGRNGRKAVATRIEKFVSNGKIPKALELEYLD